jgi:predicted secreted protein
MNVRAVGIAVLLGGLVGSAHAQGRTINVDAWQSGSSIQVNVGDTLVLRLPRQNTAHAWQITNAPDALQTMTREFAGDQALIRFRAVRSGGGRLSLVTRVSNDWNSAQDSFELQVTVRPNGGGGGGGTSGDRVTVTYGDNGGRVTLARGQTLEVKLPVQSGTGYRWYQNRVDPTILASLGSSTSQDGGIGGRMVQVFRYRAQRSGTSPLVFTLVSPGGSGNSDSWSIQARVGGGDPAHVKTVTDQDNRARIRLSAGDTLVVRLSTTAGTGYAWQLAAYPPNLLQVTRGPVFEPNNPGRPGGTGTTVTVFRVIGSGDGTVRLLYLRPWEGGDVAQKFEVSISTWAGG